MSIASPEAEAITMKQRVFIGALGVLSVVLAALVVFYFSPTGEEPVLHAWLKLARKTAGFLCG
jgi:hypothetical protein